MIKQTLQDKLLHLSIDKKDFSHRIPVEKIGKAIQWNIGETGNDRIIIKNVSKWTLRLFTLNFTDVSYLEQFKAIVQERAPKNNIDWKATELAVTIQNEYNSRKALKNTNEDELIAVLEEKYNLD